MTSNEPTEIEKLRHSCAHILAQAVMDLYPEVKLAIGPTIKDGFYYDFDCKTPFLEEDLPKIESRMKQIIDEAQAFRQFAVAKNESLAYWSGRKQPYKVEMVEALADGEITHVENGPFTDLCRGGHISSTKEVKAFKLLSIAGAYWRGNEQNRMLQRIYGTAFFSPKELDQYLKQLEEAKKRDHRKLGRQLDLFSFHNEAPGMPFYHPKGMLVYDALVNYWLAEHRAEGYQIVKTPILLKDFLWHQSGHYDHYKENMFFSEVDEGTYAVKPMNCPGGTLIFSSSQRSYRDLPVRMAELGQVHRRERSGVLHGLFRVNTFTIDDAHIFCTEDQIEKEISGVIALILRMYRTFGFEQVQIGLSTRPKDSMGSEVMWQKAEAGLRAALQHNQIAYEINEGGGAFYGPKIDFEITDSIGRDWQCGTIQLDFQMPERFDLSYISPENTARRPVMVHRAVFGSIERFFGILVEHFGGAFPVWLAPVQAAVLTISEKHVGRAREVLEILKASGLRAAADLSDEKIGKKVREMELQKVPYLFVLGDREVASGEVNVRKRGGKDLGPKNLQDILASLREEITTRALN